MPQFSKLVARALACAAGSICWTVVAEGQQRGAAARPVPAAEEWPTYGHDPGGMRYSPLKEITPANVGGLQPAWVYHMKPAGTPAPAAPPPADDPASAPAQGRGGRGGRGGGPAGLASRGTTARGINGGMHRAT